MRRRSATSTMLALLASLVLSATALGAAFDNGSFETGPAPGSFVQVNAGSTAITGWTVGVAIDYIGTYWQHAHGDRSIDMNASPSMGSISQTFDTVANNTYVVTFAMSGNPNCGTGVDKVMRVKATGKAAEDVTYHIPAGASNTNMTWVDKGYSFTGAGSSTTLEFTSLSGTNCGPALDQVRVTETVATGAQCKNNGWKTMVDNIGNAFKNQGDCVSFYATGEKNLANPKDDA
jgi:choice-of-anchor C domain-containing protein